MRASILREVSPEYIFEAVDRERGTIVWLLVPWLYDILGALDRGELRKEDYDLSCWRLMHSGAQPVPPKLIRRWKKYFPDMQYDTNYGLSEASGPGCVHLGIENESKLGAIGKAGFHGGAAIINQANPPRNLPPVAHAVVVKPHCRCSPSKAQAHRGGHVGHA